MCTLKFTCARVSCVAHACEHESPRAHMKVCHYICLRAHVLGSKGMCSEAHACAHEIARAGTCPRKHTHVNMKLHVHT